MENCNEQLSRVQNQICSWREDADGIYHSSCGHPFYFDDGAHPLESKFAYCPYCGHVLTETRHVDPAV